MRILPLASCLYRIAQEALSNALKHAQAHAIDVTVDVEPQWVGLEICDDGADAGEVIRVYWETARTERSPTSMLREIEVELPT